METTDPKTLARERLRARARRISIIRRRVVAVALSSFALAWGVIYATGSMGASTPAVNTTASTSQPASASSSQSSTTSSTSSSDSTTGSTQSNSSSSSSSSPTTVTTSQS